VQEEFDGSGWVGLVILKAGAQGGFVIEGDDRQQGIADEREILSRIDPTMAMVIFTPLARVALIMVFILNTPVFPNGTSRSVLFSGVVAGAEATDEVAGVALGRDHTLFKGFFVHPGAQAVEGAPGVGQSGFHRADGGKGVFAVVETPVAALAQV